MRKLIRRSGTVHMPPISIQMMLPMVSIFATLVSSLENVSQAFFSGWLDVLISILHNKNSAPKLKPTSLTSGAGECGMCSISK